MLSSKQYFIFLLSNCPVFSIRISFTLKWHGFRYKSFNWNQNDEATRFSKVEFRRGRLVVVTLRITEDKDKVPGSCVSTMAFPPLGSDQGCFLEDFKNPLMLQIFSWE